MKLLLTSFFIILTTLLYSQNIETTTTVFKEHSYLTAEKEYQKNLLIQKNKTKNILQYSLIIITILCLIILYLTIKNIEYKKQKNSILTKSKLFALSESEANNNHIHFTPKQKTVIKLCCLGLMDKEIADAMGISIRTVDTHKTAIFKKLGINTKAELVIYATKTKLLD